MRAFGCFDGEGLQQSAFNSLGRPRLFSREQAAGDCFYFTAGSGPASGSGCLKQRDTSKEILP